MSEFFSLERVDHFVLTTSQPEEMIRFYSFLGFVVKKDGERFAISAPNFKINLHVVGHELEPKANKPTPGSGDFCIEIHTDLTPEELAKRLSEKGLNVILGPVSRHGVKGSMTSVYLRDPDENLVELSVYPRR